MEFVRRSPGDQTEVRRGGKLGGEEFRDSLVDKATPRRKGVRANERWETDIALAERLVTQTLVKLRWRERDLVTRSKGDRSKVEIARRSRTKTPVSYQWIADRLHMSSGNYVFNLLLQFR